MKASDLSNRLAWIYLWKNYEDEVMSVMDERRILQAQLVVRNSWEKAGPSSCNHLIADYLVLLPAVTLLLYIHLLANHTSPQTLFLHLLYNSS